MKPVVITSSVSIEPAESLQPVKYELTIFDRIMQFALYQRRVLFFKSSSAITSKDHRQLLESLKRSLSEVLVKFFPLCGRMRVGDGVSSPVLKLDCSGELSVPFKEAHTDARLEELGGFEPSESCDLLCDIGCSPTYPWDPKLPLLFVQVTKFACGGLSVGICFSHQVCDGVSAWQFMKSWAEVARTGELVSFAPEVTYNYKEVKLSDDKLKEYAARAGIKADLFKLPSSETDSGTPPPDFTLNIEDGALGVKQYNLDRKTIDKLKSIASRQSSHKFSSYEAVCAFFWMKMVATRNLAETDDTHFTVLLNCRGRIKSIPKSYFGNAIGSLVVTSKVADLKQENSVQLAAQRIHDSIAKFDSDTAEAATAYIYRTIEYFKKKPEEAKRLMQPGKHILVVSSPHHPIYDCDFGFGKPAGVTFGKNDLGDSKLYLFPDSTGAGGMEVTVAMPVAALQKLQIDTNDID